MKAESKFNIGDTIYYMYRDMPQKGIIGGINWFSGVRHKPTGEARMTNEGEVWVSYYIEGWNEVSESNAYATKEELKKAVFEKL